MTPNVPSWLHAGLTLLPTQSKPTTVHLLHYASTVVTSIPLKERESLVSSHFSTTPSHTSS